jgi:hypothetical protein
MMEELFPELLGILTWFAIFFGPVQLSYIFYQVMIVSKPLVLQSVYAYKRSPWRYGHPPRSPDTYVQIYPGALAASVGVTIVLLIIIFDIIQILRYDTNHALWHPLELRIMAFSH